MKSVMSDELLEIGGTSDKLLEIGGTSDELLEIGQTSDDRSVKIGASSESIKKTLKYIKNPFEICGIDENNS